MLDYEEAQVKKAMMAAATDTIVLATADKLSKVAPFLVADWPAIRCIITEEAAGEPLLAPYRDVVDVIAV
jgi:DeoR/GlpR family transcriptional regulator of sugar metabolism